MTCLKKRERPDENDGNASVNLPKYEVQLSAVRLIPVIRKECWESAAVAAAALSKTAVTVENEALLRSFHPSLSGCHTVHVPEEPGRPAIRLVSANPNIECLDTHVGGREVHFFPPNIYPTSEYPMVAELLRKRIDTRSILSPADVALVKSKFPREYRYACLNQWVETYATSEINDHCIRRSPLGKEVWLAGRNDKAGTITATYDPVPLSRMPFPHSYRHDLSLVASPNLPFISNPPGYPVITGWASYEKALEGGPLYVCRFKADHWRYAEDESITPSAQRAIAEGSEHFWDAEGSSTNMSLLWRTNYDEDRAVGSSGSVLCYGKTTDKTALALVFQNYESPLKPAFVDSDRRPTVPMGGEYNPTFKGGFLTSPTRYDRLRSICLQVNDYRVSCIAIFPSPSIGRP
ncbi:MAG: hypothetical protein M1816_004095 [Peltula sp. TS41687]|nr:MAG: hypothetical protein M1816_004095 [Peltula sp. TS41687]